MSSIRIHYENITPDLIYKSVKSGMMKYEDFVGWLLWHLEEERRVGREEITDFTPIYSPKGYED